MQQTDKTLLTAIEQKTLFKIGRIILLLIKLLFFYIKNDIKREKPNLRFWYIISFCIGILYCFFCEKHVRIITILSLFMVIFLLFCNKYIFEKKHNILINFLLFFALGICISWWHTDNLNNNAFRSPEYNISFEGKIESIKLTSKENIFILTPTKVPNTELYNGKIRIKCDPNLIQNISLKNGDIVKIKTSLMPMKYSNFPQDKSYENYAKFFKIIATGSAKSIEVINQKTMQETLSTFNTQKYRNEIQRRIFEVNKRSAGAGIVIAVLTGSNNFIPREQLADIRHSGCAHILAISGLHMSIIVAFVFTIFIHFFALFPSIALQYNTKKLAVFPAMMVCLFYLNIANVPISATRSFLMIFIASIALLLNRKNASLNTLFITFFAMLCLSPQYIMSPSSQMSFIAVFGLITLYNNGFIAENLLFSNNKKVIKYIFGIIISSIIATFSTVFFEIYHFKQYAWIGMISNMPVIPVTEFLILPIGFIGMLLNGTFVGDACYMIAGFFANIVCNITTWTANLPHSFLTTKQMTDAQLAIIIFGIITLFLSRAKTLKLIGISMFISGLTMYILEPNFVLIYNNNLKNIVFFENNKFYSLNTFKNEYLHSVWSQNLGVKNILPMNKDNKNIKCFGSREDKNMSCEYYVDDVKINIYQKNNNNIVGVKIKNGKPIFIEK